MRPSTPRHATNPPRPALIELAAEDLQAAWESATARDVPTSTSDTLDVLFQRRWESPA